MQFTLISPMTKNNKLGEGVATSYRPVGDAAKGHGTCPSSCAMLPENGGLCYTKKFLVNRVQNLARERHDPLDRFLEKGAKFVRLHTSGDFFTATPDKGYTLDSPYLKSIVEWSKINSDITVWTYCHDVKKLIEAGYTYKNGSFNENLHIVASCDSIEDKDLATAHGFRTARVITSIEDKLTDETLCPFDLALHNKTKPTTNCKDCTLCFNPKHKKNIAFLVQK